MPLETLVEEIRARGEGELKALAAQRTKEEAAIDAARDQKIDELRREAARALEVESSRLRAQKIAAAKLASRKLLYAAREQRLERSIVDTRGLLSNFTEEPDYANVLKRMFSAASETLGGAVSVSGRSEDAALLRRVAGKSFDPTPRPILGGLVAETPDGRRRLDFSFDELLRLRGDKVRELVA